MQRMMTTLPWKLHAPGCVTTRSGGCILSTTQQFTENSIKEGKQFPEVFVATVALNQAVLFTTLQHLYVLPPVTFLCEFRFAYETYHKRILFSERCVRMLTYSILAYEYPRAMVDCSTIHCQNVLMLFC